jgi:hypothetical protein
MPRMHGLTSARSRLAVVALVALFGAAASCGGGSDQTSKFLGPWTFLPSHLTISCLGPNVGFDLTGLDVTFAKVDDSTISLTTNPGCVVQFQVIGNQATAAANQTCALDDPSGLGTETFALTKWTLTFSGEMLNADIAGTTSSCTAMGTAVLVMSTTAGAGGPHDAGGRDVARE